MDKLDEELKKFAEIRSIAQEQIINSVTSAAKVSRFFYTILVFFITGAIYTTIWFVNTNKKIDDNIRHIKTLWIERYGVEP